MSIDEEELRKILDAETIMKLSCEELIKLHKYLQRVFLKDSEENITNCSDELIKMISTHTRHNNIKLEINDFINSKYLLSTFKSRLRALDVNNDLTMLNKRGNLTSSDLKEIYNFLMEHDNNLLNIFLKVIYKFGNEEAYRFIKENFDIKQLCSWILSNASLDTDDDILVEDSLLEIFKVLVDIDVVKSFDFAIAVEELNFLTKKDLTHVLITLSENDFKFDSEVFKRSIACEDKEEVSRDRLVSEFNKSLKVKRDFARSILPLMEYHDYQFAFNFARYLSPSELLQFYVYNTNIQLGSEYQIQ